MDHLGRAPIRLDDPDDVRFRQFRLNERGLASRAQKRDDAGAGLFLAEGDLVVERALRAGCVPVAALTDELRPASIASEMNCPVYVGDEKVRQVVSGLGMPHPIIAIFKRPARPSAAELIGRCQRLVVVEAVDNPANVGAIIRNAAGLGWDGLLLDHTSADPLSRRALRVAMGTAFSLPHARTQSLAATLAEGASTHGMTTVALTPHGATPIGEITIDGLRAVLIGSERSGLSDELLGLADHRAAIPMHGDVDSLNAAAATAVACFALSS